MTFYGYPVDVWRSITQIGGRDIGTSLNGTRNFIIGLSSGCYGMLTSSLCHWSGHWWRFWWPKKIRDTRWNGDVFRCRDVSRHLGHGKQPRTCSSFSRPYVTTTKLADRMTNCRGFDACCTFFSRSPLRKYWKFFFDLFVLWNFGAVAVPCFPQRNDNSCKKNLQLNWIQVLKIETFNLEQLDALGYKKNDDDVQWILKDVEVRRRIQLVAHLCVVTKLLSFGPFQLALFSASVSLEEKKRVGKVLTFHVASVESNR